MSVRDERAAVIRRHYRQLADSLTEALPGLLDDLENIDEAHNLSELPRTGAEAAEWARPAKADGDALDDAAVGEWIRTHEQEFAAYVRKQARISGGDVHRVLGPTSAGQPALPAKPAPRRRTRT